ncbi:fructosamine kinase family protein [Lutimonas sp.]|uniref:fructosamine kinase family protein n=1 Tax=Lutimonas sp. TaxID=1872403 RepID=UPI003D9AC749
MIDRKIIEQRLSSSILSFTRLSGGDINQVYLCATEKESFVVKANDNERFPKMLKKEAQGLDLLRQGKVQTPKTIDQFDFQDRQFLVVEFIEEGPTNDYFWKRFGQVLSELHQQSVSVFGLEYDNYIGSLSQDNSQEPLWEKFFVERRISPLVKNAFDNGLLDRGHLQNFQEFYKKFSDLVPVEKPSLLHGDLWSGNLLCSKEGQPVFIDPAVYYGHREMDIAMTYMFGGFNPLYLAAYNEQCPLEQGWENRMEIHNLYPTLVHLNLFGSSYRSGVERVLKKYK